MNRRDAVSTQTPRWAFRRKIGQPIQERRYSSVRYRCRQSAVSVILRRTLSKGLNVYKVESPCRGSSPMRHGASALLRSLFKDKSARSYGPYSKTSQRAPTVLIQRQVSALLRVLIQRQVKRQNSTQRSTQSRDVLCVEFC